MDAEHDRLSEKTLNMDHQLLGRGGRREQKQPLSYSAFPTGMLWEKIHRGSRILDICEKPAGTESSSKRQKLRISAVGSVRPPSMHGFGGSDVSGNAKDGSMVLRDADMITGWKSPLPWRWLRMDIYRNLRNLTGGRSAFKRHVQTQGTKQQKGHRRIEPGWCFSAAVVAVRNRSLDCSLSSRPSTEARSALTALRDGIMAGTALNIAGESWKEERTKEEAALWRTQSMIGADGHVPFLVFFSPPWGTEAATVYGHLGLLSKHGAYGRLQSPSPSWLSPALLDNEWSNLPIHLQVTTGIVLHQQFGMTVSPKR
ncbi:hypothetical protein B0H14DRAFT_3131458 [Mycena olivaceomarginata]|nr:hypothetical protein B0H14DRAFT_3131458 [Mycena olivaceomarginata]